MKRLSIVITLCLFLPACSEELLTDLSESEANTITAVLQKNGIHAKKEKGKKDKSSVMVEEDEFSNAVMILEANGLPGNHYDTFGSMFQNSGMLPTPMEEKARFMHATTEELAKSISMLDGVINARVHLVLPNTDKLGRTVSPSSASVMLLHTASFRSESVIPKIKLLVKNSIEGIDYENISVVLFPKSGTERAFDTALPEKQVQVQPPHSDARMKAGIGALALIHLLVTSFLLYYFKKPKMLFNAFKKGRHESVKTTSSSNSKPVQHQPDYQRIMEERRQAAKNKDV